MQCKVFFHEIIYCVTLQCVLCYITLHYKFNGHRFFVTKPYIKNLTVTGSSTDQNDTLKACVSLTKKNGFFK